MKAERYANHLQILREKLLVALGCTEPAAIAYAAKAHKVLGWSRCAAGFAAAVIPNSGGMRGTDVEILNIMLVK